MQETEEQVTKDQVSTAVPKRIKALKFGLLTPEEILANSVLSVTDRNLFDYKEDPRALQRRTITKHGPNDERLGTSSKSGVCGTCQQGLSDCNGHFGHIKLALPCFHYGYMKRISEVLSCVCKDCSRILLPEPERRASLKQIRRPGLDNLRRKAVCKKIMTECRKVKLCPHCRSYNGPVKKVPKNPVKIVHHKWNAYASSNAKSKVKPDDMQEFESTFDEARKGGIEIERNWRKAIDDLHPLRVLNIFRKIPAIDVELLGMSPHDSNGSSRPENMLWTHVPVPPVPIRPSVAQESASTEDDITNKVGDIVAMNNILLGTLQKGQPLHKVMEIWEFLQVQIAIMIDGNLPGLGQDVTTRSLRGFCQRLKGKQGRFRGNLSGKRVDFSARTVISPDPNLSIDEVAVPSRVAMHMTYPEKVSRYNINKLKDCVRNGDKVHPGANFVIKAANSRRIVLKFTKDDRDREKIASQLTIGDTVERHLEDGDIVLFNRQPSLHKLSILSHRVKVRPWRTFRLNECVCNPYNADFDGDEMNLHVPQTEEARTEAAELMGVKHNLATPKNGAMIIAAIQDFITGTYLISQKDKFFNRAQFVQIVSFMFNGMEVKDPVTGKTWPVQIPPPAIWKPQTLWTGKQIWSVLLKPCKEYPVRVNLEARGKQFSAVELDSAYSPESEVLEARMNDELAYDFEEINKLTNPKTRKAISQEAKMKMKQAKKDQWRATYSKTLAPDLSPTDSYLVIRNSEVMCGTLDKATVGDGKKDSVFYVVLRDFGPEYAVEAMNRLARLSARWLGEQGFSIGIGDVYPSDQLRMKKDGLVKTAYAEVVDLIGQFKTGKLETSPGCDEEATLEQKISALLSQVREACGKACLAELSRYNAPMIMAKCGSKGSSINVAQMVAAVGQQIIGGERVVDGFENRTLPHFVKGSRDPPAKGFVVNSFFSGLNPTEFIFHAMSGREGLVDTAVKTAETGYMSRRLMKSLEDLAARYDSTVRESGGDVVQMKFGDDGLDPVDMEGDAKPVNFERTWSHALESTWDNEEPGLDSQQIQAAMEGVLAPQRKVEEISQPITQTWSSRPYEMERNSGLNFLSTIAEFVTSKADALAITHDHLPGSSELFRITRPALLTFLNLCLAKFEKSKVSPGHAVGAVGAQSIGEPGTQMTLKTFHFAGVAGMSITQGVPRIKEIINASRTISTPVITCRLESPYEEVAARFVKAVVEKTFLKDIVAFVQDSWWSEAGTISMKIDWGQVERLGLRVTLDEIIQAIKKAKSLRGLGVVVKGVGQSHIHVWVEEGMGGWDEDDDMMDIDDPAGKKKGRKPSTRRPTTGLTSPASIFEKIQNIKRRLPNIPVAGYPDALRAVMQKGDKVTFPDGTSRSPISVLVEGYGLKNCLNTPGVASHTTTTNSVIETRDVLGIEAARSTIISEISLVMQGMGIDPRHLQLLADVMTYKGDVLGITRFGLAKMRDSVLQLASFEKTTDHLFEAAVSGRRDEVRGVSESIILGKQMGLGTGSVGVVRGLGDVGGVPKKGGEGFRGWVKGGAKERKGLTKGWMEEVVAAAA